MSSLDSTREALRAHLLEWSVRTGDFTLKSGAKSTWFIDAKQTLARPEGMLLAADALLELIPEDATAIGGLTMGADPVAFSVAAIAATRGRKLNAFSIRKEAKGHGAGGRIAGALTDQDRVVITEDCVTRGTSPLEAMNVVREFGAIPLIILPVVDRGGSCERLAKEADVNFKAVLTAPELGFAYEGGL